MTERKVLIVRVKGGMQIVQGVTNYIIEGLVRGVLVLPEEVITSYAIEEFPALGVENEDTIYTVVPEGVPVIKILNKDDVRPIGAFVQVQEEIEQRDGSKDPPEPAPQPTEPTTPFRPKGAMAEIKREVFIRPCSCLFLLPRCIHALRLLAAHLDCPQQIPCRRQQVILVLLPVQILRRVSHGTVQQTAGGDAFIDIMRPILECPCLKQLPPALFVKPVCHLRLELHKCRPGFCPTYIAHIRKAIKELVCGLHEERRRDLLPLGKAPRLRAQDELAPVINLVNAVLFRPQIEGFQCLLNFIEKRTLLRISSAHLNTSLRCSPALAHSQDRLSWVSAARPCQIPRRRCRTHNASGASVSCVQSG
jgi:hypothetical protein